MGERPRLVDYAHGPLGGAIIIAVAPGTEIVDDRGSVYVVDEQHAVLGRKGAVYVTPAMYERLKAAVPLAPSDHLGTEGRE